MRQSPPHSAPIPPAPSLSHANPQNPRQELQSLAQNLLLPAHLRSMLGKPSLATPRQEGTPALFPKHPSNAQPHPHIPAAHSKPNPTHTVPVRLPAPAPPPAGISPAPLGIAPDPVCRALAAARLPRYRRISSAK